MLAQDINSAKQFLFSLLVANQVWELSAKSVVIFTILIDLVLLNLSLAPEITDEFALSFIKTSEDALTHVSECIELLHAFSVVFNQHIFPFRDLLTLTQFLNALHKFGASTNTLGCTSY